MGTEVTVLVDSILSRDYSALYDCVRSEKVLQEIADEIIKRQTVRVVITGFFAQMCKNMYDKNFDWNVGSILQHFDSGVIIDEFEKVHNKHALYESIGLSWVFGEMQVKHHSIIEFLQAVVQYSRNHDAWWRAAFSLERLEVDDAVSLLKRSLKSNELKPLEYYMLHLDDKRAIISILVLSNSANIEREIYPRVRNVFLISEDVMVLVNCAWLIGRLRLIDNDIFQRMQALINHKNYELRYYVFFSLQENATDAFRPLLEAHVLNDDPLIRKMSVRGLSQIGNHHTLSLLKKRLYDENDVFVIGEITEAIYSLSNPQSHDLLVVEHRTYDNENGLIVDESDKWYGDPAVYDSFSESEDPENLCFELIWERLRNENRTIRNPIDIATGTGRALKQIARHLQFEGCLYGVDINEKMCEYIAKKIKRKRMYVHNTQILQSSIIALPEKMDQKSSFIISSFGFPSRIADKRLCLEELKAIYDVLSDDGVFATIGWDETFNDDLNMMWFRFIPDKIPASDFEEWRQQRVRMISSPRNCGLHWYKKGLMVPLQFCSLKESAYVMGHLFGRDASHDIIRRGKIFWSMSLGITYNTKEDIRRILASSGML